MATRASPFGGHPRQDIDIAGDQCRFGDNANRMVGFFQNFENFAGHPPLLFDRLIGSVLVPIAMDLT